MLIIRLIFIALALFLAGFGIHPAFEYNNTGAFAMLILAVIFAVFAIILPILRTLVTKTLLGKILFFAFFLLGLSFVILQALIINSGHPVNDPPATDALVVLGAGLTYGTEEPSLALSYRLDKALEYLKKYPDTPVIVSGGHGEIELVSEAYAMQQYLVNAGINKSQIILEDRSTTTAENISYSAEIIEDRNFDNILIVTSDFHCFRATLLASRQDLNTTCLPADNVWWLAPADNFREVLAVGNALIHQD